MDIVIIKGIFLKYILLPLVIGLLALLLSYLKRSAPRTKSKVLIVYILIASLCLGLPGLLGFFGNTFNPYGYLIAMIVYLFLGILNVYYLSIYIDEPSKPVWFLEVFEGLITIVCTLAGGYIFYLIYNLVSPFEGYGFMAATSLTIFMLPLAFQLCYNHYLDIPFEIYKTWQVPSNNPTVEFEKIKFKSLLLLNLELTKTIADGKKSRIDAKAPSDGVSFGDWFYRVTDDYNHKYPNSRIELHNPNNEPYSWIFYMKKSVFHFRKFIDFDKTIHQNGLTERSTIICKRVINSELEDKNYKHNR